MTQMAAPSWDAALRAELEARLAKKRDDSLRLELETRVKNKRLADRQSHLVPVSRPLGHAVYAETGSPVSGFEPPVNMPTIQPPDRGGLPDNLPTPAIAPWRGTEPLDPENLPLDEAAMRSVARGVGGLANMAVGAARFAGDTGLSAAFAPQAPPSMVAQGAQAFGGLTNDVFTGAAPSLSVSGHNAGIGRLLVERGPEALVGTAPFLAAGAAAGPVAAAAAMGMSGAGNQYAASRDMGRPVGEAVVDAGVQGIIDGAFGMLPAKAFFGANQPAGNALRRAMSGAVNMAGAGAGQRVATAVAQRVRDIDPAALERLPDELKEGLVIDTALGALLGFAHNRPKPVAPEVKAPGVKTPPQTTAPAPSESISRVRAEAEAEIARLEAERAAPRRPWELTEEDRVRADELASQVRRGNSLTQEDQAFSDELQQKVGLLVNATPRDAAKMSDSDWQRWKGSRRNGTSDQAMDVASAALLRGDEIALAGVKNEIADRLMGEPGQDSTPQEKAEFERQQEDWRITLEVIEESEQRYKAKNKTAKQPPRASASVPPETTPPVRASADAIDELNARLKFESMRAGVRQDRYEAMRRGDAGTPPEPDPLRTQPIPEPQNVAAVPEQSPPVQSTGTTLDTQSPAAAVPSPDSTPPPAPVEAPVAVPVTPSPSGEPGGAAGASRKKSAFRKPKETGPTPEEVSRFFDESAKSPDDDGSMLGALADEPRSPAAVPPDWADSPAPKRKSAPESFPMTTPDIARVSEAIGQDVTQIKPEGIEIARGRSTLSKVRSGGTATAIRPYIEMLADAAALVKGKKAKSLVGVRAEDLRPGDSFVLGDRRMAVERRSASEVLINDQEGRTFRLRFNDRVPMEDGTFRQFGEKPMTKKEAAAARMPSDEMVQRGKDMAEKVKAAKPKKFGDVVIERLEKKKTEAKARIKADDAAVAKLRREGKGRSIGAAPIFARAFNEGVIAASEAVQAAILGGRKLESIIDRAVARIPKEYGDQRRAVAQVVRAILKGVRVGKGYDAERFEAAVAEARKAVPSSQKSAEVKANVRAATGQVDNSPAVKESTALAAAFKKAQAASAVGFRAGAAQEKARARVVLATVRAATKMSNANEKAIRDRLVDTVNGAMPQELRGKMNRAIARAKSMADLSRAADRIEAVVATSEANADSRWIKRASTERAMRIRHKLTEDERKSVATLADQAAIRAGMLKQEGRKGRKADWIAMRDHANRIADIKNEIKEIIHNRRTEGKIIANGKAQSVRTIQSQINPGLDKIGTDRYDANTPDVGFVKKYLRWGMVDSTFAALIDRATNGPAKRELVTKIRAAEDKAVRVREMNADGGEQIVKAHGYKSMLDFDTKVGGAMGKANESTVDMVKAGRKLTLGEAMNILAADAPTMEKILSGRQFAFNDNPNGTKFTFDSYDIAELQRMVGAENMKLIGAVKALREKLLLSDLKRAFRDTHGHDMADIPGQWPTHANIKGSDSRQIPTGIRDIVRHFLEQSGRLRDREGNAESYLLGNFRNEWHNAVRAEAAIAHLSVPIRNAGMIFLTGDTKTKLVGALGEHAAKFIEDSLDRASGVTRQSESVFDQILDIVRGNAGRAFVSLNLGSAAKQVVSASKLLGHFDAGDLAWAMSRVWRPGLIEEMAAANPYLWQRYIETSPYAITGASVVHGTASSTTGIKALGEIGDVLAAAVKSAAAIGKQPRKAFGHARDIVATDVPALLDHVRLISASDSVPARLAYLAAYRESVRNNPNRTKKSHAKAAGRKAEEAIRELQNPVSEIDYPRWGIDSKKSGTLRAMMQFKTEGDINRNILVRMHLTGELYTPKGAVKAGGVLGSILSSGAITAAWGTGIAYVGSQLFGQMDEKKRKAMESDMVKSAALDVIRSFGSAPGPFMDELAQLFGSKALGGRFSNYEIQGPVIGTINKAVQQTANLATVATTTPKSEKERRESMEKLLKAMANQSEAIATAFGIPVTPTIGKAARTWRDIHDRKYKAKFKVSE